MSERPATRNEMLCLGTAVGAVGLYFILVGASLLPIPGGPRNLHAPLGVVMLCGMVFFLGGAAVLIAGIGGANTGGKLAPDAPRWMHVTQYLIGVGIFGSFAMIASWVAFGSGERKFTGSAMGVETAVSVSGGRIAFGIGAVVLWLILIAITVSGARKLFVGEKT